MNVNITIMMGKLVFFATTEFIDCIHRQLCKVRETG